MFRVENADFIADKLASELLPNQEYREAYKNAEEAITRRLLHEGGAKGRVELDVDWALLEQTDAWYLACCDNGDGMTRNELERYMTTLAVRGAANNQSLIGNQGMGLKISGPTRHKRGVLIRSLKNGERSMVQVGWNEHEREYGLIPLGPDGELIVSVPEDMFPDFINAQGSGTVVTFLGTDDGQNTFSPSDRPRGWLFKYMHQRFFRLSGADMELKVRVPAGDQDDWARTRAEADERQRGEGGKSFNLSTVRGTATIWDKASERQGDEYHGAVDLPGDPTADIPSARLHWWVLPSGPGTDVTSRTAGGGSIAVLFQNELHDWRTGGAANPFFGRLGVLFGKTRIVFILEPLGTTISSDFARAHVLEGGRPVFESDAWLLWSDQFRDPDRMPEVIKRTMAEEQERIQAEDPERARRIRDRLKDVMGLLRPRRFRKSPTGGSRATGPSATGPEGAGSEAVESGSGSGRRRAGGTRGIGSVLTQANDTGEQANEIFAMLRLDPRWVTETEADNFPIVNGNGRGLRDRAAALAGEDGVTASILLLNREFRGYQAIVTTVNDWANPEGDEDKASLIEGFVQEWVEQKMVESVTGLRQLENGQTWLATNFDDALSPVALTAVFMADRYHTLREVKRQAGSLRQRDSLAG